MHSNNLQRAVVDTQTVKKTKTSIRACVCNSPIKAGYAARRAVRALVACSCTTLFSCVKLTNVRSSAIRSRNTLNCADQHRGWVRRKRGLIQLRTQTCSISVSTVTLCVALVYLHYIAYHTQHTDTHTHAHTHTHTHTHTHAPTWASCLNISSRSEVDGCQDNNNQKDSFTKHLGFSRQAYTSEFRVSRKTVNLVIG